MKKFHFILLVIIEIFGITLARLTEEDLIFLPNKANYEDATNQCKSKGLNLIKIKDGITNMMVLKFAKRYNLGRYWIDGIDKGKNGQWVYNDGSNMTYTKWKDWVRRTFSINCIEGYFYFDRYWRAQNCFVELSVICYREKPDITETFDGMQLVSLNDKTNYEKATNLCKSKGMNLIKIQDDNTNTLVHNFALRHNLGRYWIDGNDITNEGQWVYNDGSNMTYAKWAPTEPNDYDEDEDCLQGYFYMDELWNDNSCDLELSVICYRNVPNRRA